MPEHMHLVKATARLDVRIAREQTVEANFKAQLWAALYAQIRQMEDIRSHCASIQDHLDALSEDEVDQTPAGSKDSNTAWLLKQRVLW